MQFLRSRSGAVSEGACTSFSHIYHASFMKHNFASIASLSWNDAIYIYAYTYMYMYVDQIPDFLLKIDPCNFDHNCFYYCCVVMLLLGAYIEENILLEYHCSRHM